MSGPRPIRVLVDRLVLHGVDRADAAAVQRALAAGLRSALAGAEFGQGGTLAGLRLDVAGTSDPAELGRSAAAGIAPAIVAGPTGGR